MKDFLLLIGLITLVLALYISYTSPDLILSRGLLGLAIFSLAFTFRRIEAEQEQEAREQIHSYTSSPQLDSHE